MRCLSLARARADEGAEVLFLLRSHAAALTTLIRGEGHSVCLLPDPQHRRDDAEVALLIILASTSWQHDADRRSKPSSASDRSTGWIVDHYALGRAVGTDAAQTGTAHSRHR